MVISFQGDGHVRQIVKLNHMRYPIEYRRQTFEPHIVILY